MWSTLTHGRRPQNNTPPVPCAITTGNCPEGAGRAPVSAPLVLRPRLRDRRAGDRRPTTGEAERLSACLHSEVAVCDDAHSSNSGIISNERRQNFTISTER